MSSLKTTNLNMHKWEPADPVQRTEFNENFQKIDEHAQSVTTQLADIVTVNVKLFGAKGNGVTDDKIAIQNAINSLPNGGTVFLPKGIFICSSTLWIGASNITFTGNGTLKFTNGSGIMLKVKPNNNSADETTYLENITIKDITINGVFTSRINGTACLEVWNIKNINIDNVVLDGSNAVGLVSRNCVKGTIKNCLVQNTKADGIHLTQNTYDFIVQSNKTYNTGDDGIAVFSPRTNATASKKIVISNNIVQNSKARGIAVAGGSQIVINANIIENTSCSGIVIYQDSVAQSHPTTNVIVSSNILSGVNNFPGQGNPNETGGTVSYYPGIMCTAQETGYRNSNITIVSNQILDGQLSGIQGYRVDKITINNNTINSTSDDARASHGVLVTDSTIATISDNTITNTASTGITVDANCIDVRIIGNSIDKVNRSIGASIDAIVCGNTTDVIIMGNRINAVNTCRYGISTHSTLGTCQVIGNIIKGTFTTRKVSYPSNVPSFQSGNLLETKTGTITYSGDGIATSKTIPHGLSVSPTYYHVECASDAAGTAKIKYVTADALNLTVFYNVAPASGSNNVVLRWKAEV